MLCVIDACCRVLSGRGRERTDDRCMGAMAAATVRISPDKGADPPLLTLLHAEQNIRPQRRQLYRCANTPKRLAHLDITASWSLRRRSPPIQAALIAFGTVRTVTVRSSSMRWASAGLGGVVLHVLGIGRAAWVGGRVPPSPPPPTRPSSSSPPLPPAEGGAIGATSGCGGAAAMAVPHVEQNSLPPCSRYEGARGVGREGGTVLPCLGSG